MTAWLYAQVFLAPSEERLDCLLLDHVQPLLERLERGGLSRRFFFILYGEGGFHLRLRVCTASASVPAVRAAIEGGLERAYRELACLPPDPRLGAAGPELRHEWAVYEAEIDKHGGPLGQALAEAHFEDSTRTALAFRAARRRGLVTRSQVALRLLDALHGELLAGPRASFFGPARDHWLELAPAAQGPAWRDYFDQRARAALPALGRELAAHPAKNPALEGLLGPWRRRLAATAQQLAGLESGGRLLRPRPALVHNFAHMLCNRLGVPVLEEAFLSHLLAEHAPATLAATEGVA